MICTNAYVGIDPGSTGAVAFLADNTISVWDVPLAANPIGGSAIDDEATLELARMLIALGPSCCVFEHTWGVKRQAGQYKFGDTAGALRMAFRAAGHRVVMASAQKWKGALRLSHDKDRSVERALSLWPAQAHLFTPKRGTLKQSQCEGRAEAALIAEYGRKLAL